MLRLGPISGRHVDGPECFWVFEFKPTRFHNFID